MRLCLFGDSGLLGQALVQQFGKNPDTEILGISSSKFSPTAYWNPIKGNYRHQTFNVVTHLNEALAEVEKFKPTHIINSLAIVNLKMCEDRPELAQQLHVDFSENLSKVSSQLGCQLAYISTDQMFDGKKQAPYSETDRTNPLNNYGRTKLLGEEQTMAHNQDSLVLRTNIVGFRDRPGSPTFAEWLCSSLEQKQEITLFDDYITSSIHVADFSQTLESCYDRGLKGILNVASHNPNSKYEFGQQLAKQMGWDFSYVKKGQIGHSKLTPPRPSYLCLDVGLVEKKLNKTLPDLSNTVVELANDLKKRTKELKHASRS